MQAFNSVIQEGGGHLIPTSLQARGRLWPTVCDFAESLGMGGPGTGNG